MSDKNKSKASWVWIKNTAGQPSMSATFATVAFVTTTLVYVASVFEKIGPFSIRPFDPGVCSAYLIPVLGLYFSRRFTDEKFKAPVSSPLVDAVESAIKPAAPENKR
jgi:hypothetical protein